MGRRASVVAGMAAFLILPAWAQDAPAKAEPAAKSEAKAPDAAEPADAPKAGPSYGQKVRELYRSQSDGILACHKSALKDGRTIEGLVKVSWLIDRTGKVVSSKIIRTTIGDEPLEKCILDESRTWGFPPREGTHFIKKSRTYSFRMPRGLKKG